ncbi:MAG: hypothetical protein ACJAVI_006134 [Candidatus Azotimanducaceae bacterium]|jgi:hypothetical protein
MRLVSKESTRHLLPATAASINVTAVTHSVCSERHDFESRRLGFCSGEAMFSRAPPGFKPELCRRAGRR